MSAPEKCAWVAEFLKYERDASKRSRFDVAPMVRFFRREPEECTENRPPATGDFDVRLENYANCLSRMPALPSVNSRVRRFERDDERHPQDITPDLQEPPVRRHERLPNERK